MFRVANSEAKAKMNTLAIQRRKTVAGEKDVGKLKENIVTKLLFVIFIFYSRLTFLSSTKA